MSTHIRTGHSSSIGVREKPSVIITEGQQIGKNKDTNIVIGGIFAASIYKSQGVHAAQVLKFNKGFHPGPLKLLWSSR